MGFLSQLCVTCAWRQDCKLKYSMGIDSVHCPEYTRDLRLKEEKEDEPEKPAEKKQSKAEVKKGE